MSKKFKDFATPEAIKLIDTTLLMSSRETPFVPEIFLKKKKDLRISVVDSLSGFFSFSFCTRKLRLRMILSSRDFPDNNKAVSFF